MSALTAPRYFRDTDTGAPVLAANTTCNIAFHDAILVTGYPLSTATELTYSAGKVNVQFTAHGMEVGDITTISGADQDEYNGKVQVTDVTDADNFKYVPLSTPGVSPATGTIKFSQHGGKPGLGWQLVFSDGTSKRAYRPRYGNRFYLRLEQTNNFNARARGFETMSDVDNGTGPFPTPAQLVNGVYFQHGDNSGTEQWWVWGTDTSYCSGTHTVNGFYTTKFFGDFPSFKAGDLFNTLIVGQDVDTATSVQEGLGRNVTQFAFTLAHYIARSHTQAGSAVGGATCMDLARANQTVWGGSTGAMPYPCAIDGGLHISRVFVNEAGQGVRGYLNGIWGLMHNVNGMAGVALYDEFSGSDGLAGRTFKINPMAIDNVPGAIVTEMSDTLDS